MTIDTARADMVELQIARRGISDPRILDAFRAVPRESFLPPELAEFAYADAPLPIAFGQTVSQPYVAARTFDALALSGRERMLLVGTGSGYSTAIASRLVSRVVSVEKLDALASRARERLVRLGCANVEVRTEDGLCASVDSDAFDAIAVFVVCPEVPAELRERLAVGGRLVLPIGADESSQTLVRVTREGPSDFREEPVEDARSVPMVSEPDRTVPSRLLRVPGRPGRDAALVALLRENAEPFDDLETSSIDSLIERIGDARVVLLGEATHGTSEFYRMRARISRELVERGGFDFVAVEADWPDAARVDAYVVGDRPRSRVEFTPFSRFPQWMWRNDEVHEFIEWLRTRNQRERERSARVGFHGLDLYSLFTSIAAVLGYLDEIDPDAARVARYRYGTLTPWQRDPVAYGRAVLVGRYQSSEDEVVAMLRDLLARRLDYAERDGERFFDAAQNARVVANAERYYRAMYYGSEASWNLRDTHMFDTLMALLAFYGPRSRGIVWEHNSHVGDASATEMSSRGELNIGQLCRAEFREQAYLVGFGTDHGTVAAASNWDDPVEMKRVRPSHPESYERLFHETGIPALTLHLRSPRRSEVRDELAAPRLERAIGVIYRPETERASHYFHASLPNQFDELVWFDETHAVSPLAARSRSTIELPETHPFGL